MKTIKVDKQSLLDVLRKNRTKHSADFEKAVKEYRAKSKTELTKALKGVLAVTAKVDGKDKPLQVYLHVPQSYLKDYDRTINMLEMDTEATVELDQSDYERYVEDNWEWKGGFSATNALYAGSLDSIVKAPRKKSK